MKTVLIIDDEVDVADVVKSAIEEGIAGSACTIELDFEKSAECIKGLRPDAIVLDLMEGHQSANLPGQHTWRSVWESTFCPIVIYTGSDADLQPPVPPNHPFVKRIQKGAGTQAQVVAALSGFAPAVQSVSTLRAEVDAVIHKVLRDTAGDGYLPMKDVSHLLHAGRRRIAASMDDPTLIGNRKMLSWEVYLVPAIGKDSLTGDILFKRGTPRDNPESYRLMLSPSCDLARGGKGLPALVAKCATPAAMIDKFKASLKAVNPSDGDIADKDLKKALGSLVLSQGTWNGWYPLPAFVDSIPACAANLKDLELIPIASIGPLESSTHEYVRVASIDSPFREQVAWAYLTTAARPGMPDRELQPWAEEIVNAATPPASATATPAATSTPAPKP
jgi:CTP synthase